jgi:hypothetical protein
MSDLDRSQECRTVLTVDLKGEAKALAALAERQARPEARGREAAESRERCQVIAERQTPAIQRHYGGGTLTLRKRE